MEAGAAAPLVASDESEESQAGDASREAAGQGDIRGSGSQSEVDADEVKICVSLISSHLCVTHLITFLCHSSHQICVSLISSNLCVTHLITFVCHSSHHICVSLITFVCHSSAASKQPLTSL